MILLQQAGAAVLLALITLCLQCGGAAALIIWVRSIPRETQEVRGFHCARGRRCERRSQSSLCTESLFCYERFAIAGFAFRIGNLRFTFRRAVMRPLDMGMLFFRRSGACWARSKAWSAC